MSETSSISILSEKCQKCPEISTCNEKRMEACAYIIPINTQNMVVNNTYEPNLRNIKLDSITTVTIDMNEIAKVLSRPLSINCGVFRNGR